MPEMYVVGMAFAFDATKIDAETMAQFDKLTRLAADVGRVPCDQSHVNDIRHIFEDAIMIMRRARASHRQERPDVG